VASLQVALLGAAARRLWWIAWGQAGQGGGGGAWRRPGPWCRVMAYERPAYNGVATDAVAAYG